MQDKLGPHDGKYEDFGPQFPFHIYYFFGLFVSKIILCCQFI